MQCFLSIIYDLEGFPEGLNKTTLGGGRKGSIFIFS